MPSFLLKPTIIVGFVTISGLAFAQETIIKNDHVEMTIGQEIYKETYREFTPKKSGIFVKHEVPVAALFAKLRIPLSENNQISFVGRYGFGLEKYIGALHGGEYGSVVHRGAPRSVYEIQAAYGYTLPILGLTPSIGGGYRRLTDNSDEVSVSAYRRVSQYGYVMAGLSANLPVNDNLTLSPTFNYKYIVDARQYSLHTEQKKLFKQHDGHGFEASLPFKFKVKGSTDVVQITPFYRAWNIAKSDVFHSVNKLGQKKRANEPHNTTQEIGVDVSYSF